MLDAFRPRFWLPERMLGQRGTVNGIGHVEGRLLLPVNPRPARHRQIDYRARRIAADERDARLAERRNYLMRVHGYPTVQTLAGPRKVPTRWVCGAHGGQKSAVVACPNRPGSLADRPVTLTPAGAPAPAEA